MRAGANEKAQAMKAHARSRNSLRLPPCPVNGEAVRNLSGDRHPFFAFWSASRSASTSVLWFAGSTFG